MSGQAIARDGARKLGASRCLLECPKRRLEQNGGGGIRTPETGVARLTVFKTVAFNQLCHPSWDGCPKANGCERPLREIRRPPCKRPARRLSASLGGCPAASKLCPSNPGEVAERLKALAC
jgi:hypothetical protein